MAIPHAKQGQKFDIPRLGPNPAEARTQTLFKTPKLEVMRLVILQGKEMPTHSVAGSITVQCLEGCVAFSASGQTQELREGQILYLEGGQEHALKGIENSALLLTILL
jgi:quercetin dioxygenase-like cupin family protein